jgi:iron complex transport system permease protein
MSKRVLFYLLSICFISLFILDLFLGSVSISFTDIIKTLVTGHNSNHELEVVIFDFRLPKALAAILAGIALSVSGLQMQTVFRNPLAGPDVLGISSGASLGVALLVLGLPSFFTSNISSILGNWALIVAACAGAATTLFIILMVSSRVRDIMTILILGILIGAAISSIVSILQFFGSETLLKSFVVWTLGSLGNISKLQIGILSSCIAIGLLLSFSSVKKLDALLLGEKYAFTMGLNLKRTRLLIFISTSILAGSTTAFCGPIAFIGIAIPHICRILFKTSEHKILLFATIIAGAAILLLCDILSQLPGSNLTLPINSVTALIGIPIVIWIITRNRKLNQW